MKPLIRIGNKTPVPYSGRSPGLSLPWSNKSNATAQIQAMGSVGTLFNIVSTTSQAVSEVEWKLWRKSKSGDKNDRVEVTTHAALDLWNTPNKFMTRQELVESVQQHVDLTGEGWCVVGRNPKFRSIPLELWPVRPDRMSPVPSPTEYVVGYVYTGPNGELIPLEVEDVLFQRMPNPDDPYRGLGPVQSVLLDLDSAHYSAAWNRNFFLNSAQPGGVIEVDKRLTDTEFKEMTARWREQHQGVANAHRVAVIEQGKWVTNQSSMKEMQFVELRNVSKEVIREAFGFPKFAAGDVDDVNRATAEASSAWFARRLTVPRLERWKGMLNNDLLPLFKATDLEFDYVSPVLEDREANNAERNSVATAVKTMSEAGVKIDKKVLGYYGLPTDWQIEEPPEPAPPAAPVGAVPADTVAALLQMVVEGRHRDDEGHRPGFRPYWH